MLFEDEKNKKITYMDKKFKISRSHCYYIMRSNKNIQIKQELY